MGVCYETAWSMKQKLMTVMREWVEQKSLSSNGVGGIQTKGTSITAIGEKAAVIQRTNRRATSSVSGKPTSIVDISLGAQ